MWSFGSICRIGCSRSRSSWAWAAMPGTREMMKSALATIGGMPRSPQTAAIAPSMLTGSGVPFCAVRAERQFHGADHLDVSALDLELQRHLEQPRRARIAGVETVAEAGQAFVRLQARGRRSLLRQPAYDAPLPHQLEAGVEKLHAALDVAAVVPAEAEHAGGHARAQRRAGRRGVPRRQRRRRRGAVVDERHQHRFHQAADGRRRHSPISSR